MQLPKGGTSKRRWELRTVGGTQAQDPKFEAGCCRGGWVTVTLAQQGN